LAGRAADIVLEHESQDTNTTAEVDYRGAPVPYLMMLCVTGMTLAGFNDSTQRRIGATCAPPPSPAVHLECAYTFFSA